MEEITFVSNYDGLKLSAAECAVRNPRAVVQIVHGMSEHKERYYPFMEFLAEHGIASVADDHRGHGASVACQEDLGYFGSGGAEALLSDIHQLTVALRGAYPGKPLFLLGHSMGALTVRSYIQRWGREIDGLIVSGNPGWNPSAPMGLRIARRAQQRRGSHARSRFLTLGLLVPFQVKYGKPFTRNAWVCSNEQVVADYNADPLCGFEFYANGYEALMQLMIWANTPATTAPHREMPVAFFSGAKDPCMGGKRRLKAAAELLRRAGYTDVSVKTYPGMAHEILNETGREEVYDDMLAKMETWLENSKN